MSKIKAGKKYIIQPEGIEVQTITTFGNKGYWVVSDGKGVFEVSEKDLTPKNSTQDEWSKNS